MPGDLQDPVLGRLLDGRFQVLERIARGGMATVYEADDLRLHRKVAVKVMHPHLGDDEQFRERFIQEAHSAARLSHANVVNVYDQGEDHGLAYLVMELVPSITLRDLLAERGAILPEQALDVTEAVLAGLAAAHRAGIVHRDLKPENILLAHDGRIKIGDFGLARAVTANTATGKALLGTIAYLSPELVTRGHADKRSDIYAIGIMLFEMLTGTQPFTGDEPMQIAFQHANEQVPLPSSRDPRVPEALDALVHWATQRDPNLRPADAAELLDEVRDVRARGFEAPTRVFPAPLDEDDRETAVVERPLARASGRAARVAAPVGPPGGSGTGPSPDVFEPGAATLALERRALVRQRRGMLWLALVVLGALLAAGIGWWFNLGPGGDRAVPDVANEPRADAVAMLEERGIEVAGFVEQHDYDIGAGRALGTDPPVGSVIGNGDTVQLVVSLGRRQMPVPPLEGLTLDEARAALAEADLALSEDAPDEVFDANVEAGRVIAGFSEDGTPLSELDTLEERSVVAVRLSLGAIPVAAGDEASAAEAALEAAGLVADFSATEHSREVDEGRLISVAVPEGLVRRDATISGVVSLGPPMVQVPDVTDRPIAEAVQAIRDAGLEPDLRTNVPEALHASVTVISQDPAEGELVEGSTVVLEATY